MWRDWWWHKHLHVSPPSTIRLLQTINPDINRDITFILVVFNGDQQRDLTRLGIYHLTRPTFERRETLGRLSSLNANMTCQRLKIEMLNGPARHQCKAISASPYTDVTLKVLLFEKKCFVTLKGNYENWCNLRLN